MKLCLPAIGESALLGPHVVDYLAYADDLVLLSSDPAGLQTKLEEVSQALAKAGMHVNLAKSFFLTIGVQGKRKRWYVNQAKTYSLGQGHLSSLNAENSFKYLGIQIGTAGKLKAAVEGDLLLGLERVARAPLKPQQRVEILRSYLIPRLLHRLVLGRVSGGLLNRLDIAVRRSLRTWLRLPSDVSVAWLHSDTQDGGLSIPSLRVCVPSMIQHRQEKMMRSSDPVVRWCASQPAFGAELNRIKRLTVKTHSGLCVTSRNFARSLWRDRLHRTCDGVLLKGADKVPRTHDWIRSASSSVPGWIWIKAMVICSGSAYTRARAARGRGEASNINCQGHCGYRETITHILQQCSKTHGARIERHDFLVARLRELLDSRGYSVTQEPCVPSGSTYLKPDLIGWRDSSASGMREVLVLDVQVVATANTTPLRERYLQKVRKYAVPEVEAFCRTHFASSNPMRIHTHGITVTWNGIIAKETETALVFMGLSKEDIRRMAAGAVWI